MRKTICLLASLSLFKTSRAFPSRRNPISNLFSDMTSVFGRVSKPGSKAMSTISSLDIESWDQIKDKLHQAQTPEERNFRFNVEHGYGELGSPLNKIRLYNEKNTENDIRVTFYRDSASWCPYCQRVWLALELKQIPYRVEKINMRCYGDKPASFTKMQPSGQIPVAVIDGKVYGQSDEILYILEQNFPGTFSLLPQDKMDRAQQLLRLERQIFSAWMYWLTGGGNSKAMKQNFIEVLDEVERELQRGGGPFFLGSEVSLVDIKFIPFLERMCASLLFFKGFQIRYPKKNRSKYVALNKYFDAMDTLPAYQLTKGDYYSHCWDLPPQLGGCTHELGCEPFEKAINGERLVDGSRGSWELPLEPDNGGIEPDWEWCGDDAAARREAVERILANTNALIRFSCRGSGRKGMPPVSAPLSDPNATPNEDFYPLVEQVLKIVSLAMLDGADTAKPHMEVMAKSLVETSDMDAIDGLVASIAYLRDRIGVPRDMRLPAARNFRAHLNWSIGIILDAKG